MDSQSRSRISIQVSLGGYSFKVFSPDGAVRASGWMGADRIFNTPEFQRRYDEVEIALFTHKVALVPAAFFDRDEARAALSEVAALREGDAVGFVEAPWYGAVLVFSNSIDESLSRAVSQTVFTTDGYQARVLPEMYYILRDLGSCRDYNKILASWRDGWLHLAVAQGKSLLLCNVFPAPDFTTAQYFIFLTLNRLQLNPEVSAVTFRTPLTPEQEMSMYRYFKAVEVI